MHRKSFYLHLDLIPYKHVRKNDPSNVQNPVLVKDLLFLSLHYVSHVCFVLNQLNIHTLDMYRHEREPS